MSRENPGSLDFTIPLFIHNQLLLDGHDTNTRSATGTFVKFGGRYFVVTCSHVRRQANHEARLTLAIHMDPVVYRLSTNTRKGLVTSFGVPCEPNGREIDVAIASVDHAWSEIVEKKAKRPVDLDNWIEADWSSIRQAKACGWTDHYKEVIEGKVATRGVEVIAGMASSISVDSPAFTMHSAGANTANIMLSGISGGVIVALEADAAELPIGIVFEGFPAGTDSITGFSEGSYAQEGDIMVRGHLLTPEIFENWLDSL